VSLVGYKASPSAENLDTGHGSGNDAQIVVPCLAPWHHHVPAASAGASQPGEAGTAWKGLHGKVQNISFLLLGSQSPTGLAAEKPPLAARH